MCVYVLALLIPLLADMVAAISAVDKHTNTRTLTLPMNKTKRSDDSAEEWDRYEALHGDVDKQERTKCVCVCACRCNAVRAFHVSPPMLFALVLRLRPWMSS